MLHKLLNLRRISASDNVYWKVDKDGDPILVNGNYVLCAEVEVPATKYNSLKASLEASKGELVAKDPVAEKAAAIASLDETLNKFVD